tara:strand:- start:4808 stop:5680 length:873 start_codon:yes stop_codon:yes gene_type:complete
MKYTPAKFNDLHNKYVQLSDEQTFNKEVSFAVQIINNNSYLQDCEDTSVMQSVYNTALIGLSLNPVSKQAYLVPRYVRGRGKIACLEPSYQGLVKLITDTGSAKQIYSHCVYEHDEFEIELGFQTNLKHLPKFKSKTITGCYAVAVLADDTKTFEYMDIDDLYAIRDRSESYKAYAAKKVSTCIWVDHEQEMCRKTVIRRLCKYLPKSDQWNKINEAINLDESDYSATFDQVVYASTLLRSSNIDHDDRDAIERNLNTMTAEQISKLINDLKDNQSGFDLTKFQQEIVTE